jgi:hypothetical protein
VDKLFKIRFNDEDNMANEIINFQRHFQVWRYTKSHGQLLLRSERMQKNGIIPTRVDVFFKNVAAIHLPASFDGLSISEASEAEKPELHLQIGSKDMRERKVFIVRGSNFQGYVIAGIVVWHEDDGEYDTPSFFRILPLQEL